MIPAELWLTHADVREALGDPEADRYYREALSWVADTAEARVPEPYRQDFLKGNRVHGRVLDEAVRRGFMRP